MTIRPVFGIGTWTVVSGTGSFGNIHDPKTVSGLSTTQVNAFRWTITNGVCASTSDVVNITRTATATAFPTRWLAAPSGLFVNRRGFLIATGNFNTGGNTANGTTISGAFPTACQGTP